MSGCCGSSRSLDIEVRHLDVGGSTCDRCSGTLDSAREAASVLRRELAAAGVDVIYRETALAADRLADSNEVLIDGRSATEWLGATEVETDCPSCGELIGASACCRAVEVDGVSYESLSTGQIRDAAYRALGMEPLAQFIKGGVRLTVVTDMGCA